MPEMDMIDQIIGIYQKQIEQYQNLAALYEREKLNLTQGRGDEKAEEIMMLVASKDDLMRQVEIQREQAKGLQQKMMEQFGIHDFRLSLLKPHILPEQKEALKKVLDQIGTELLRIRSLDTENQKLLQEYMENHQTQPEQKSIDQALEIYRQSIQQGNLLKKL